ncbi:uncharacterized protein STEHIDRAFT_116019 [Stereum hirsutum FP-91666 SS1]|uniref:Uncharacterized protein n=1 Tax=Stereum hirsutum (strain FP-91666) TaxID=721885 RepID=R7RXM4_STEHR|nr:uncharacterized protein STEHIDRAFT_116019 [Stereum hirsutum FP-91666 SS1]EIM80161.1 hypothetical protein STEHIDRAFT_116019 [Stereum hirsutum FP-91666 SS1]
MCSITPARDRLPPEIWLHVFHFVVALEPNDTLELDRVRSDIEAEQRTSGAVPPATLGPDASMTTPAVRVVTEASEGLTSHESKVRYRRPATLRPRRYLPAMAVVSHICTQWRHIALAHSSLWAIIRLLHHGLWPYQFLIRSQSPVPEVPDRKKLDVCLDLSDVGNIDGTLSLLVASMARVESLSLAAGICEVEDAEAGRGPRDLMNRVLDRLAVCEAPVLRSITFTLFDDNYDQGPEQESDVDEDVNEEASGDAGNGGDANEAGGDTNIGQSDGEEEMWDDIDGHDDNGDVPSHRRDVEPWETVGPIAIPAQIFEGAPPPYLTHLSVTAPLHISPSSPAFTNITNLSLFDISEKAFWNVVHCTPLLEELYVAFHSHFHVPAASPLTTETLVKDLVFLSRLRELRVRNSRVSSFRRFFHHVIEDGRPPLRRLMFDIRAFVPMGRADAKRLWRAIKPMHAQNPFDIINISVSDWGGRFVVGGGPSSILDTPLWQCPWALIGIVWPFRIEVSMEYDPTSASPWVHLMWPDIIISPSQLALSHDLGRFFPSQWLDVARRFPYVETLKIDDPLMLILTTLWSESSSSKIDSFPYLKTLIITADEIPRAWRPYPPPDERLHLMRRALTVIGSSLNRRPLERLVFMQCDPAFDEGELRLMKELAGARRAEMVWVSMTRSEPVTTIL